MARFYSLKKKDEDDGKTADPFGVLSHAKGQPTGSNDSELSAFGLRHDTASRQQPTTKQHIMAKAYEFLADGFEEIEALAPVDILRRSGIEVTTVSIGASKEVTSAHGVTVTADAMFGDTDLGDADLLLVPGGMPGASNIDSHEGARKALAAQAREGRLVGAICAGPMVLGHLGLLNGKRATCYPGFEGELEGAEYTAAPVTVDGNIVTGKGPGASMMYAYTLVEMMMGERVVTTLKEQMMYDD